MDLNELKDSILKVIGNNEYELEDLKEFLVPVLNYIDNQVFIENLTKIVNIILEDRDGNKEFSIKDLELLKEDVFGITNLISSILLILGSIPEFKLKYVGDETEKLIFKILLYIFMVVVPKETEADWDLDHKTKILDLILAIYQMIKSSQVTKDIIIKLKEWFKKKGWCKCLQDNDTNEEIISKHLPSFESNLRSCIINHKDKIKLESRLHKLERNINSS